MHLTFSLLLYLHRHINEPVIKWWELFNFAAEQLIGKGDVFIGRESYFLFDIQFHLLLVKN